ncbi:hypothetical protein EGW08_002272, partial [Elysia chlorotica]
MMVKLQVSLGLVSFMYFLTPSDRSTCLAGPICHTGWQISRTRQKICVRFQTNTMSWQDARNTCLTLGGDLLKILDVETLRYINDQLMMSIKPSDTWIGLRYHRTEKHYRWNDEKHA